MALTNALFSSRQHTAPPYFYIRLYEKNFSMYKTFQLNEISKIYPTHLKRTYLTNCSSVVGHKTTHVYTIVAWNIFLTTKYIYHWIALKVFRLIFMYFIYPLGRNIFYFFLIHPQNPLVAVCSPLSLILSRTIFSCHQSLSVFRQQLKTFYYKHPPSLKDQ